MTFVAAFCIPRHPLMPGGARPLALPSSFLITRCLPLYCALAPRGPGRASRRLMLESAAIRAREKRELLHRRGEALAVQRSVS